MPAEGRLWPSDNNDDDDDDDDNDSDDDLFDDDDVGQQVVERSDSAVRPIGQSVECPQYTPSNRGLIQ